MDILKWTNAQSRAVRRLPELDSSKASVITVFSEVQPGVDTQPLTFRYSAVDLAWCMVRRIGRVQRRIPQLVCGLLVRNQVPPGSNHPVILLHELGHNAKHPFVGEV